MKVLNIVAYFPNSDLCIENKVVKFHQVKGLISHSFVKSRDILGLGLAVAKSIVVEKHGGTIAVNSTLGKGTEFLITLLTVGT